MAELNVAVLGDGGVGKSTYLKKLRTGRFDPRYIPTSNHEKRNVSIGTPTGIVKFNTYDYGGQQMFEGTRRNLHTMNAIILMFDVTHRFTFNSVLNWRAELPGNVPVVLCGNKTDCTREISQHEAKLLAEQFGYEYCEISSKTVTSKEPFSIIYKTLVSTFAVPELLELCRIRLVRSEWSNLEGLPTLLVKYVKEYTDKTSRDVVHGFF